MARIQDPKFAPDCTIEVDGQRVPARRTETVTSALLAAGRPLLSRSAKYHRPRGPFCLAASCSSCLVRVDGVPNVRACETPCRDGLRVETQNAVGGAARDLLGVIDILAPRGIDHHRLATWSHVANRLAVSASRHFAGLGTLPDRVESAWPKVQEERFDAVVVGSGPSGLGAAEALAAAGHRVLLCERERALGGRLRCRLDLPGDPPLAWAADVAGAVGRGGEVATRAAVLGLWPDGADRLLAIVHKGESPRVRLVRAPRVVVATGSWAQPPVFPGNEVPGVHGARGLLVALAEDGVVPGEVAAVLGEGPEAAAVAARLAWAGMKVETIAGGVVRSRGRSRLSGLELESGRRVACDTLAVATPRVPAAELAREAGAALELNPELGQFRVKPGEAGAVAPGVWAVGEVTGACRAVEASDAGRRAGEAAARV
jgi:sarcosine oxidase subunit alpha